MSERKPRYSLPPVRTDGKCRGCEGELPKGRKAWCSDNCRNSHWIKASGSYARHYVFQRDRGVCCLCGVDTEAQKEEFIALQNQKRTYPITWIQWPVHDDEREWLKARRITTGRISGDWWDADHINPVVEGGGSCGIDNLRTLCIACHKNETAKLAAKRAAAPCGPTTKGE